MTSFAKLFPLLIGLGLLPMSARAQIYPDKPITIVCTALSRQLANDFLEMFGARFGA